jgi:hypothetical protein
LDTFRENQFAWQVLAARETFPNSRDFPAEAARICEERASVPSTKTVADDPTTAKR